MPAQVDAHSCTIMTTQAAAGENQVSPSFVPYGLAYSHKPSEVGLGSLTCHPADVAKPNLSPCQVGNWLAESQNCASELGEVLIRFSTEDEERF